MAPGIVPREELVGRLETGHRVYLAVVQRLAWRPGSLVTTEDLIDYVWRYDPDGGPLRASASISNAIHSHDRKLRALGWQIENCWMRWRLVTAEPGND